jgi:hypothetical protein
VRQIMMMVMALAAFGAMVATAQAENQTPGPPTASHPANVSQTARPSVSVAHSSGLKLACLSDADSGCLFIGGFMVARKLYCKKVCNFSWERCMKTGFCETALLHRPAERH